MARYAISDIHGCAKTFEALLDRIHFSTADQLFLLGDYIDRGPDSKGVIDKIWALEKEGYETACLQGNHEQMLIDEITGQQIWYNGEKNLLASFAVSKTSAIPGHYIDWMVELKNYLLKDEFIFVHAGLNFGLPNPLADTYKMRWIRNWYEDIDHSWLGERIIVHGHTPIRAPRIRQQINAIKQTPAIDIDAGCSHHIAGMGQLCALNLDTMEAEFVARLD